MKQIAILCITALAIFACEGKKKSPQSEPITNSEHNKIELGEIQSKIYFDTNQEAANYFKELVKKAASNTITLYEDKEFAKQIAYQEAIAPYNKTDTFAIFNPETGETKIEINKTEFNLNQIVGIKTVGQMQSLSDLGSIGQIIYGWAPLVEVKSDGFLVGETPLFWVKSIK